MPWGELSEKMNSQTSWSSSSWGSSDSTPKSWGCSGWGASPDGGCPKSSGSDYQSWGSSEWGTSVSGSGGWGTNGFGYNNSLTNGWGNNGLGPSGKSERMVKHRFGCTEGIRIWGGSNYKYDESCPGCRQDRAVGRANTNIGSAAIPLVSMFIGSKPKRIAKKSLWG